MIEKLVFSITVVFYFVTCFTSATDVNEVGVRVSQTERTDYTFVDTVLNKKFSFNKSELVATPEDECKCKNGKCMRVCDVKKTTPCEDQKKVCVCNPGYAKKEYEDECEYCDCGGEINCTFQNDFLGVWKRVCICPDGYFYDYFYSKCKLKCSEERPCQNGGTCGYDDRCHCPYPTSGDFCQEIEGCSSRCENRLEVDCLLHDLQYVYCNCKNSSLYYDEEARICKPCDCENGFCDYYLDWTYTKEQKLACHCNSGYIKFNGHCKECDCGAGSKGRCEFDSNGEKICECFDGFYERDGHCHICGCNRWSDMDTKCEVTGNEKRCFCKEGLQDVFGHCEDIDECETKNTCPFSATCINTFGSFTCECPEGYWGNDYRTTVEPGEVCEDIDECLHDSSVCALFYNVKCVNIPGSYKCECQKGYEPNSLFEVPYRTTCVRTKKNVGPSFIVLGTTIVLIAMSYTVHRRVKKRAENSN